MMASPYMASTGRWIAATPRATRSAARTRSKQPTVTSNTPPRRLGRELALLERASGGPTGAARTADISGRVTGAGGLVALSEAGSPAPLAHLASMPPETPLYRITLAGQPIAPSARPRAAGTGSLRLNGRVGCGLRRPGRRWSEQL